jgi:RNA polymerase sigma-70 factor, ECF subfamily
VPRLARNAATARLPFDDAHPGRASREAGLTVQALRERRIETLAGLLDAHGREIQGVAFLILRDRGLAEDVTIETLLTAYERGGTIREEAALRPWLLRVATNKALTVRRSEARIADLSLAPEPRVRGDLAGDAAERVALLAAVGALPMQMRAAVVLRYYADLPVEGVAAALGKSPNTIKAQRQVALDRLRRSLAEPRMEATQTSHA